MPLAHTSLVIWQSWLPVLASSYQAWHNTHSTEHSISQHRTTSHSTMHKHGHVCISVSAVQGIKGSQCRRCVSHHACFCIQACDMAWHASGGSLCRLTTVRRERERDRKEREGGEQASERERERARAQASRCPSVPRAPRLAGPHTSHLIS